MEPTKEQVLDCGAWIGRQQAFAVIANQSLASRAKCLSEIHRTRAYEATGLNWEDFAEKFAGLSSQQASRLIDDYQTHGEAFLKLSEIARISPITYEHIAGTVEGDTVEIEGERFEITQSNGPRIRIALRKLHNRLREQAAATEKLRTNAAAIRRRLDRLMADLNHLFETVDSRAAAIEYLDLVRYGRGLWHNTRTTFKKSLDTNPSPPQTGGVITSDRSSLT